MKERVVLIGKVVGRIRGTFQAALMVNLAFDEMVDLSKEDVHRFLEDNSILFWTRPARSERKRPRLTTTLSCYGGECKDVVP